MTIFFSFTFRNNLYPRQTVYLKRIHQSNFFTNPLYKNVNENNVARFLKKNSVAGYTFCRKIKVFLPHLNSAAHFYAVESWSVIPLSIIRLTLISYWLVKLGVWQLFLSLSETLVLQRLQSTSSVLNPVPFNLPRPLTMVKTYPIQIWFQP